MQRDRRIDPGQRQREVGDEHGAAHVEICHELETGKRCEAAATLIATQAPPGAALIVGVVVFLEIN